MGILMQQDWPRGEESFGMTMWIEPTWPLIVVVAVVVVVGGSFWYRKRKKRK